jgi:hypothetical protein
MRGTRWLSGALFLLGCSIVPVFVLPQLELEKAFFR